MTTPGPGRRPHLEPAEAADYLSLTVEGLEALVAAGYLAVKRQGGVARFAVVDLKAFLARNADNGSGNLFDATDDSADPGQLIRALDAEADDLARRSFDIFAEVFPDARAWGPRQRRRFVEQARDRFQAILAVTDQGVMVDEGLLGDLQDVGAAAAWDGSSLPQLLVVLRISRDLVVQRAVELAEGNSHHSGTLALLLTRVLPAMDRLTDALAQGYWAAVVRKEEESRALYEHVVEHASDGIYEVDLEGCVSYANPSMAVLVGLPLARIEGAQLGDLLAPLGPSSGATALFDHSMEGPGSRQVTVVRHDGVRRVLDLRTLPRMAEGAVVGFQGVVRDVTAAYDLEAEKNEFLGLVTTDLRSPLSMIVGLGATLESHSDDLPAERIRRMGSSIRGQAERIARMADDLYDVSRLESGSLLLSAHPVDLAAVVEASLDRVDEAAGVTVRIPGGVTVQADARRLEQVVANLIENALEHGAAPVLVELVDASDGAVEMAVTDAGPGVPATLVPTLFSRLRTLGRSGRDRARGTGLGLSLVQGLVESMGGRVWYLDAPGGGASFHVSLPAPRHHGSRRAADAG